MGDDSRIRVGTSGWSYPSGEGTWNGVFYPAKKLKGFDELAFYAEHFDTVEVNSSFYRVPALKTTQEWAKRTPKDFEFSLKLFQKFTHPEMFLKATGEDPADIDRKDVDDFRAAIEPLARAGKLGALLAQHGAALVQIDEPKFKISIRQDLAANVKTFYYLRLHGRKAAQWWKHDKSEDRYNYLYSAEELEPMVEAATEASREVKKAYMYANNHFSAKSVANAATIKAKLGQELDGEYPASFVQRYPDLKGLVRILPTRPSDTLV